MYALGLAICSVKIYTNNLNNIPGCFLEEPKNGDILHPEFHGEHSDRIILIV